MIPERRAEVVRLLRAVAQDIAEGPTDEGAVFDALNEAADAMETKPSESSMVQRIEAWEMFGRQVLAAPWSMMELKSRARELLDGPPDPERDREALSEVLKP